MTFGRDEDGNACCEDCKLPADKLKTGQMSNGAWVVYCPECGWWKYL